MSAGDKCPLSAKPTQRSREPGVTPKMLILLQRTGPWASYCEACGWIPK
jgi:hypothetical protein